MRVNTVPSNCTTGSSTPESYHLNDLGPPTPTSLPTDPSQDAESPAQKTPLVESGDHNSTHASRGWLVALATTLVAILVPHLSLCHGMVATQMLRTFPSTSWTAVAGLYAAMLAVWNVMGPVTSLLLLGYSSRWVSLLGGLILTTGLSLSVMAPNIIPLYMTLGIMTGGGASIVEHTNGKFLKWYTQRDVASKTCLFIRTVGQLLAPQCLLLLLDTYGLLGGLLILGSITSHVCVAALLYPGMKNPQTCCQWEQSENKTVQYEKNNSSVASSNAVILKKKKKKKRKKSVGDKDMSEDRRWKNPSHEPVGTYQRGHRMRTISLDSSRMLPDIPEEHEPMEDEDDEEEESTSAAQVKQLFSSNDDNGITATRRIRQESTTSTVSYASSGDWETRRNSLTSSLSSVYSDSSLSITSSVYSESSSELGSNLTVNLERDSPSNGTVKTPVDYNEPYWRISDFKFVLKDPLFWIVTVSFALMTLVSSNVLLYVPLQTLQLGFTLQHIACLLSLYVFTNIVGRLLVMWLFSKGFKPRMIFMLMGFFTLVSIAGLIFADFLVLLIVCTAIFGCASGACNVIMSPILLFSFEGKLHSIVVAFIPVGQAFLSAVGTPLIGLLVEKNGILAAFSILVALQAFSVAVWAFLPLTGKCRKMEQDVSDSDIPDL